MFTGLIQQIGIITALERPADLQVKIESALDMNRTQIGASICCSGVCLSVIEKGNTWFKAEISAETLSKTTAAQWKQGTRLNLEPSLKLGDELGGHLVFRHVDGPAVLRNISPEGGSHRLFFEIDPGFMRFVAPKGSVALDGVSLTVNEVGADGFGVNIIPHTWSHTTLGDLRAGDKVNFEIDMLARYVDRRLGAN